jgi:thiamine pyrophosphokinase
VRPLKGLLCIAGAGPDAGALGFDRSGVDLVVAADAGLLLAMRLGFDPDLVVGDMDSLPDRSLLARFEPARLLVFPAEKDETDTEIGLRVLRERGCTDVTIAGGGGGRIDHLLAIAALFERGDAPRRWVTDGEDIRLVDGPVEIEGWQGSTLSLLPLAAEVSGMSSEGLAWPLAGLVFRRGWGGISNRVISPRLRVSPGNGKLLMIRTVREDPL